MLQRIFLLTILSIPCAALAQEVSLTQNLAANPTSQTQVRGVAKAELLGLVYEAQGGNIRLTSLRIMANALQGTLSPDEVFGLGLYDGDARISNELSLNPDDLSVVFDTLSFVIQKGERKRLVLKGTISTNADNGDEYFFFVNSASSVDVKATDEDDLAVNTQGVSANAGGLVTTGIVAVGDITVTKIPEDTETAPGVMISGQESALLKLQFGATHEDMLVQSMTFAVEVESGAIYSLGDAVAAAPVIFFYEEDGTPVGNSAGGYHAIATGELIGQVIVQNLNWKISTNESRTLVVKTKAGAIPPAREGTPVRLSLLAEGFKAQGATANVVKLSNAPISGNYKTLQATPTSVPPVLPEPWKTSFLVVTGSVEDAEARYHKLEVRVSVVRPEKGGEQVLAVRQARPTPEFFVELLSPETPFTTNDYVLAEVLPLTQSSERLHASPAWVRIESSSVNVPPIRVEWQRETELRLTGGINLISLPEESVSSPWTAPFFQTRVRAVLRQVPKDARVKTLYPSSPTPRPLAQGESVIALSSGEDVISYESRPWASSWVTVKPGLNLLGIPNTPADASATLPTLWNMIQRAGGAPIVVGGHHPQVGFYFWTPRYQTALPEEWHITSIPLSIGRGDGFIVVLPKTSGVNFDPGAALAFGSPSRTPAPASSQPLPMDKFLEELPKETATRLRTLMQTAGEEMQIHPRGKALETWANLKRQ